MKYRIITYLFLISAYGCGTGGSFPGEGLDYCIAQLKKSMEQPRSPGMMPRNIVTGRHWNYTSVFDWTSGFWPGTLWYAYEYTGSDIFRQAAETACTELYPVSRRRDNHDIGFMMYCSLGNGLRLTGSEEYREVLLESAASLASLYNPVVGTIDSWPGFNKHLGWQHSTIIDNMLNLELLFWASRNGGGDALAEIAERHAEVTMNNHFRDDFSTYHVVGYDTVSGQKTEAITHQGHSDGSMWARGQAWAIYGFTMCYRETGREDFLRTACNAADLYLSRLPQDMVPYWDFDAPDIPDAPRDASAAAITASALLELSQYVPGKAYRKSAVSMLETLSSDEYRSGESNDAFLRHVTGHYPGGSEIDVSIIYADYYYIEALTRLRNLEKEGKL